MGADIDVDRAQNINKLRSRFDVTHTEDIDEARRWSEQLSEGGRQVMPFEQTFWSPGYGSLWIGSVDGEHVTGGGLGAQ